MNGRRRLGGAGGRTGMRSAVCALALLPLGCGSGVDGRPGSTPVTPGVVSPAPEPPAAPVHRAQIWVMSRPGSKGGYIEGDTIRLVADFEERVSVTGSPRLAIKIGDTVRYAAFSPWVEDDWPPERLSFRQRFDYLVRVGDRDEDGISVGTEAFDFAEGGFLNAAGMQVEVEIYSVTPTRSNQVNAPGADLNSHPVVGTPEPRICTNEREQARAYGSTPPVLVEEWDGTPFRFYWDAGIPESERPDAEHFFEVVEKLSERIEEQIGYSILEVAGWIGEDERGFRISHTNVRDCRRPQSGRIVATVVPEEIPNVGLVIAKARPRCGVLFWTSNDVDTTLDGVMAHELFHLFGFTHSPESTHPSQTAPGVGYPMSVHLTNEYTTPRELGITFDDVDALRCVFPHPDFAQ